MTRYWLMKSEPTCFSIDDLYQQPNHTTAWDGVRNYQARNFIRDDMRVGDLAFFYHSNCAIPSIVGTMEISSEAYPDETAFDPNSKHPDLTMTREHPRWFVVDVCFKEKYTHPISLEQLRTFKELANMQILRRGNRLSITPISQDEWMFINVLK